MWKRIINDTASFYTRGLTSIRKTFNLHLIKKWSMLYQGKTQSPCESPIICTVSLLICLNFLLFVVGLACYNLLIINSRLSKSNFHNFFSHYRCGAFGMVIPTKQNPSEWVVFAQPIKLGKQQKKETVKQQLAFAVPLHPFHSSWWQTQRKFWINRKSKCTKIEPRWAGSETKNNKSLKINLP